MSLRSFPCKRCGAAVPISAEALRDPAATPVCPGCGQRYARKAAPAGVAATSSPLPTASKFTSQKPAAPALAPTRSLGAPSTGLPATFASGEFVANRYRVLRFVARGGMGEVYEAEDVELRGRVALKTIHAAAAGESGAIERFKREIHLARRVTHPNVCRIFDVGFHELGPERPPVVFLTMELLEGETLATRLKRAGRLSPAAALPIARQLAAALGAAHEAGVIHRDFKTENVFLVPTKDGERAVVTDFGIARGGDDRFHATLTADGNVVGTPAYMAPEQVEGGAVSPATDQYSLGVVLFEMLTGELPFRGDNPISTAARRLTEPAPSPRRYAPELDPLWEATILRCLERRPEDRFRDVGAVVRALEGQPSSPLPVAAPPVAPASPAAAPAAAASSRRVLSVAERRKRGLLALLVVALAGASYWGWRRLGEIQDRLGPAAPVAARRAVAVLDLRDLAGRAETAWLATALSEMLASELAQGGELRVVPGESVARALDDLGLAGRDRLEPAEKLKLRRRLGADYLVLGSYATLAAGGAVRLDLRLEDARAETTVATVRETGAQAELFDLVARAGSGLASALGAARAARATPALPTSPEAARLYAEGLDALRAFEPQRGRELLEQAVAADPQNPMARSALATALGSLGYAERSEQEARRARELAGTLPAEERLLVEARYFETAREWARAAEIYQRLWSAYPDVANHGLRLAACRTQAGQPEQALAAALALRNLPPPDNEDPRIDLAEAAAAGALADFRRQADAAARAASRAEADGASLVAAEALVLRGQALRQLGRGEEARAAIERARALSAERANRVGVAAADAALGGVLLDLGQPAEARAAFERALGVARELGDRGAEAGVLNSLAVLARGRGENEAARSSYEQVVALFEETGNRIGLAYASNNLAVCLTELGEFDAAAARVSAALDIWREAGDKAGLAAGHGTLGGVRRRTGDLAGAESAWREALALRRETGQRPGEAVALNGLALTLLERGELPAAAAELAAAERLARELGAKSALATALAARGEISAAGADTAAALAVLTEAQSLRRELGERAGGARLRAQIARLDLEANPAAAAVAVLELIEGAAEERAPEVEAAGRIVLARALAATGDVAGARRALEVPGLFARLSAAQRLDWRLAEALVASAGGRPLDARRALAAVRDEATARGFGGAELEAAVLEATLAGAAAPDLAARARAAGFEALARRAERLP